ncbi:HYPOTHETICAL PROTEIN MCJ_004340 [Mesomycoplasma conjunctivae]|uniref:Uncharacterized protein n=1 Tax=Mesomycoplasma conjunctivae (strain ATCC 25834 / NCTC 10147 / HRC/581) TaxID=572263 RepID=C5J6M7_MESCH|nr:hypothetical protein [Mesomycoplasma conjunctivae]CAT05131.1 HYPOTHETICAL PROTEIN MCJ_004340 [Mesomycoplasma conjunctivae]
MLHFFYLKNTIAVIDLTGLDKAATYEIERVEYANGVAPDPQATQFTELKKSDGGTVTSTLKLIAESTTIKSISYNSSDTKATIEVQFDEKDKEFLKDRYFKFVFKPISGGRNVEATGQVSNANGSEAKINLEFNGSPTLEPATYYTIEKIENVKENGAGAPAGAASTANDEFHPLTKISYQAGISQKAFFATKPQISDIEFVQNSETSYTATFNIKDPLAGQTNSFEGKSVKVYYEKLPKDKIAEKNTFAIANPTNQADQTIKLNGDVKEKTATISGNSFSVRLDDLDKNAYYKILGVSVDLSNDNTKLTTDSEIKDSSNNYLFNFANNISDVNRSFHVIPESATITEVQQGEKSLNKAKLTFTFDKDKGDFFLANNSYKDNLKLVYRGIGGNSQAQEVNLTKMSGDENSDSTEVKFEANISQLDPGSLYSIIGIKDKRTEDRERFKQANTSVGPYPIVYTFGPSTTRTFATLASIAEIRSSAVVGEQTAQTISIRLKDQGDTFKNNGQPKILELTYAQDTSENPTAQDKTVEIPVTNGQGSIKLTSLAKYGNYTIKSIKEKDTGTPILVHEEGNTNTPKDIPFEQSITDKQQNKFQVQPTSVKVDDFKVVSIDSTTAKVKFTFDNADKLYLDNFTNLRLNYSAADGRPLTSSVGRVTDDKGQKIVEFDLTNLEPAKYSVDGLTFEYPLNSSEKRVKVEFAESLNISKRSFTTQPQIIAARAQGTGDKSASFELELADPHASFVGRQVKIDYRTKRTRGSRQVRSALASGLKSEQGSLITTLFADGTSAKALVNIEGLRKDTTYEIVSIELIGGLKNPMEITQPPVPPAQDYTIEDDSTKTNLITKEFTTLATSALVTHVESSVSSATSATVKVFFNFDDDFLLTKNQALYLRYRSSKGGAFKVSPTSVSPTRDAKRGFYYEFSLTDLDEGSKNSLIDLSTTNTTSVDNDLKISVGGDAANIDRRSWTTTPTLADLNFISSQNSALLRFKLENTGQTDYDNKNVKIKYKKISDITNKNQLDVEQEFSNTTTITNGIIQANIERLERGSFYKLESLAITDPNGANEIPIAFSSEFPHNTNHDIFNTKVENASLQDIVVLNNDKNVHAGKFEIKFDASQTFLIGNYQAAIRYGTKDNKVPQLTSQFVDVTKGAGMDIKADISLTNLVAGQNYEVKEVILQRKANKQFIENVIFLPQQLSLVNNPAQENGQGELKFKSQDNPALKTKVSVAAIFSNSTREKQATIDVFFNNVNQLLYDDAQVKLKYKLKTTGALSVYSDDQVHEETATFSRAESKATFNLDSLIKDSEYSIEAIEWMDRSVDAPQAAHFKTANFRNTGIGTSGVEIPFDGQLSDRDNFQRKFNVIAQTATINNIEISNITNNAANLKVKFAVQDDAYLHNQQIALKLKQLASASQGQNQQQLIVYSKQADIDVASQHMSDKARAGEIEATFDLSQLEAGSKYQVESAIISGKTVTVNLNSTIDTDANNFTDATRNRATFVTKTEITNIVASNIGDNSANLMVTLADSGQVLNGKMAKLKLKPISIVGLNKDVGNAQPVEVTGMLTTTTTTTTTTSGVFNFTSMNKLQKHTRYEVESFTVDDSTFKASNSNSASISFSDDFGTNKILEANKFVTTTGSTLEYDKADNRPDLDGNKIINGYSTRATGVDSAEIEFIFDKLNVAIARGHQFELYYAKISTGRETDERGGGTTPDPTSTVKKATTLAEVQDINGDAAHGRLKFILNSSNSSLDHSSTYAVVGINNTTTGNFITLSNLSGVSPASVAGSSVTIPTINGDKQDTIKFTTQIPLPKVTSIEVGDSTPLNDGTFNGDYAFETKITIQFDKNAEYAFDDTTVIPNNNFKVRVRAQERKRFVVERNRNSDGTNRTEKFTQSETGFNFDDTETSFGNGEKYQVTDLRYFPDPLGNKLEFKIKANDIRRLMGAELEFHIGQDKSTSNTLKYYKYVGHGGRNGNDKLATQQSEAVVIDRNAEGNKITAQIKPQILIEDAVNSDVIIPGLIGYTFAVYDPLHYLKEVDPFADPIATDLRYLLTPYSTFAGNIEFKDVPHSVNLSNNVTTNNGNILLDTGIINTNRDVGKFNLKNPFSERYTRRNVDDFRVLGGYRENNLSTIGGNLVQRFNQTKPQFVRIWSAEDYNHFLNRGGNADSLHYGRDTAFITFYYYVEDELRGGQRNLDNRDFRKNSSIAKQFIFFDLTKLKFFETAKNRNSTIVRRNPIRSIFTFPHRHKDDIALPQLKKRDYINARFPHISFAPTDRSPLYLGTSPDGQRFDKYINLKIGYDGRANQNNSSSTLRYIAVGNNDRFVGINFNNIPGGDKGGYAYSTGQNGGGGGSLLNDNQSGSLKLDFNSIQYRDIYARIYDVEYNRGSKQLTAKFAWPNTFASEVFLTRGRGLQPNHYIQLTAAFKARDGKIFLAGTRNNTAASPSQQIQFLNDQYFTNFTFDLNNFTQGSNPYRPHVDGPLTLLGFWGRFAKGEDRTNNPPDAVARTIYYQPDQYYTSIVKTIKW